MVTIIYTIQMCIAQHIVFGVGGKLLNVKV